MSFRLEAESFLRALLDVIIEAYSGKVTVILFGGRARGTSSDSGDFDVMVILKSVVDPIEEAVKIRRKLHGKRFPLDIVVVERKDLESLLIRKMLEHHKILYDGLKLEEVLQRQVF
ncbi:MAG: nucleotidyltransferase domain-containing protein [Candidatus Jordarchaeales archaeon]